jgi:hypothetical protein
VQIIEQNEGAKIGYTVEGARITFDGKLTVDLEAEQEDVQKIVDVSLDNEGNLIQGVGQWYVANIIIPPREYSIIENENGEQTITALPVNREKVVLILWTLPNNNNGGAY